MKNQNEVTERTINSEKKNTDNLNKLLMNLKDIISENPPDYICKTSEIKGYSFEPDDSYTFCWLERDIPTEFTNEEIETFDYICFGFEGKSCIEEIPNIYNLGCSSLMILTGNEMVKSPEVLRCYINFNLLPSRFINKYESHERMNIVYRNFEEAFHVLIKPYLKSGIGVTLPEPSFSGIHDYFVSNFKSILLEKENE